MTVRAAAALLQLMACFGQEPPVAPSQDLRGLAFDELHAPTGTPDGGALVLGALDHVGPGHRTGAGILGRWEGQDLALPVPGDWKVVLVVERIEGGRGSVVLWAGTSLQRPRWVARFPVEVRGEGSPVLAWRATLDGVERTFSFRHDPASDRLLGTVRPPLQGTLSTAESVTLGRARTFLTYRDYRAYLAGKRITAVAHASPALARFGQGSLVYLPPGYEAAPDRRWPLILFLCGSGDVGGPVEELAKASPFLFIRERGDLPAVIVAPALSSSSRWRSFPTEYMEGVLDEAVTRWRVDPSRVAVTGLSMGGEAALRLALVRPERIAAVGMLSMADPRFDRSLRENGFQVTDVPYARAAAVPFYVVNGGRDPWVSPAAVRETVEALRAAGVKTAWKVLPEAGHDTWTATYADPGFYEWLLGTGRAPSAPRP